MHRGKQRFYTGKDDSQVSKSVYLLDATLVHHIECNPSTVLTVLLSVCSKRRHEHVVQNVK